MLSWAIHLGQRQVSKSFQTMSVEGSAATTTGFYNWDFPWSGDEAPMSQRFCQKVNMVSNQQYLPPEPSRKRQAELAREVFVNKIRTRGCVVGRKWSRLLILFVCLLLLLSNNYPKTS